MILKPDSYICYPPEQDAIAHRYIAELEAELFDAQYDAARALNDQLIIMEEAEQAEAELEQERENHRQTQIGLNESEAELAALKVELKSKVEWMPEGYVAGLIASLQVAEDERQEAVEELAALKARRCETCKQYTIAEAEASYGECSLEVSDDDGLWVSGDFSCGFWTARAEEGPTWENTYGEEPPY